jgi:hypothetical protein
MIVIIFPGGISHNYIFQNLFDYSISHENIFKYEYHIVSHKIDSKIWEEKIQNKSSSYKLFTYGNASSYKKAFEEAVEIMNNNPIFGFSGFNKAMILNIRHFMESDILQTFKMKQNEYKNDYNKINNMLKGLDNYDKRLKNIYGKELIYKLLMIKTSNSSFNYNNNIHSTNQPKRTKLKFKNKIQKNDNIISDKNAPMRKILPSLVRYLQSIINKRNQDSLDNIKYKLINNKFCQLLKSFNNKTIKPDKEEFVRKIRREAKYAESRPVYQVKLFKLLRKK